MTLLFPNCIPQKPCNILPDRPFLCPAAPVARLRTARSIYFGSKGQVSLYTNAFYNQNALTHTHTRILNIHTCDVEHVNVELCWLTGTLVPEMTHSE